MHVGEEALSILQCKGRRVHLSFGWEGIVMCREHEAKKHIVLEFGRLSSFQFHSETDDSSEVLT